MTTGPDAYPVAYCAPGSRLAAALTLMLKGEQVARIEEHAWLEGKTDVIVVSEPPELLYDLEALRVEPGPAVAALSSLLEYRSLVLPPLPPWTPITSV